MFYRKVVFHSLRLVHSFITYYYNVKNLWKYVDDVIAVAFELSKEKRFHLYHNFYRYSFKTHKMRKNEMKRKRFLAKNRHLKRGEKSEKLRYRNRIIYFIFFLENSKITRCQGQSCKVFKLMCLNKNIRILLQRTSTYFKYF